MNAYERVMSLINHEIPDRMPCFAACSTITYDQMKKVGSFWPEGHEKGEAMAGQALAALRGREYTLPDDIKSLAVPVLAHRLILKEQDRLRGDLPEHTLEGIIKRVPVPVNSGTAHAS